MPAAQRNRPNDPEDCAACGFEASAISKSNAVEVILNLGSLYHTTLADSLERGVEGLRRRPDSDTWSALEYTAHMRDVIAMWGWGLHRLLTGDQPELPAVDPDLPDRVASESAYNTQDPMTVVGELTANAERMARRVKTMSAEQWHHTAQFGEMAVTPLWIVRKVAHEGHHHLLDIQKSLSP